MPCGDRWEITIVRNSFYAGTYDAHLEHAGDSYQSCGNKSPQEALDSLLKWVKECKGDNPSVGVADPAHNNLQAKEGDMK